MNRTLLISIGLICALVTAAGIMEFGQRDIYKARRQLHSESSWVRSEALLTLIIHNDRASIPEIIRLLKNNDLKTRLDAIGALGNFKAKEAIHEITILLQDAEFTVRGLAVWALGEIGARELIPKITKLLQDNDYHVREAAVKTLVKLNAREAIPEIIKLLQDNDTLVLNATIDAVVIFRSKEAIPELKKLLTDKDKGYSLTAKWVLEYLGVPDSEIEEAKYLKMTIFRQFTGISPFDISMMYPEYLIFHTQDEINSFLSKMAKEGRPVLDIGFSGISDTEMCLLIFAGEKSRPREFITEIKEELDKIIFRYEIPQSQVIVSRIESEFIQTADGPQLILTNKEVDMPPDGRPIPFGYFVIPKTDKKIIIEEYHFNPK